MEIRHSNVTLLHLGSNLHCLMPTRLPIIILSIMLVMEIRHSLQILDLLKFESPLLDINIILIIRLSIMLVMKIRHSNITLLHLGSNLLFGSI